MRDMDIENPMVIDSHWRHHETLPKVVGECAGCQEEIYEHEEWFENTTLNVLVHQNSECCYQLIADMSICRNSGE